MKNGIYHSAEGSTWTKKNHKYIRKEGNRYIYADDLKTDRANRDQIDARQYKMEQNIREKNQSQNRKAAANGQIVNPTATWRGSDGRVIAREKTNEKISAPTAYDYKKYGQLRGGAANRSNAMSNQGSTDYKQLSKQQSRKKALNSQGSSNRQQEAKDFKEYQDWERADAKKRDSESKRKAALNNQGKNDRQDQTKHTLYEKRLVEKVEKEQKETEKPIIEKKEKETILKEQSPSENKPKKKTNKALEKGKEAISKIKNAFRKKTDREKGVISTREYRDYGKVNPGTLKEQMIRDGSGNKEHYDYTSNRQALYNNEESRKKAEKKYRKGKSRYEPVSEYDNGYDPDTDSKRFRERYEEKKRRR